jgi:hypothetical protein
MVSIAIETCSSLSLQLDASTAGIDAKIKKYTEELGIEAPF